MPKPLPPETKMNKTESAYANHLHLLKCAGEIIDWRFEGIKFRLADGAIYTPDFLVVYKDRFEIHETKGFWREAARVRIKVAADLYPWFPFRAIKLIKGNWVEERINHKDLPQ
jgi:hypothetical protein